MKKRKIFPSNFAVLTTFAVVSLFGALCMGQDAQQAEPRGDPGTPPAVGQGTAAQTSAAPVAPAETARDTAQSPGRRASVRPSDRRNAAQAGKNRRNPAGTAESEQSAAPAKGNAVPAPPANAISILPAVTPGDPVTGGEMWVPPALAANNVAAASTGSGNSANSGNAVAAKATEVAQDEHSETPAAPEFSLLKAAGGFGLVLSLIALGYLGARKYFPQHFTRRTSERNLKLIETLAIGEKRSVAIIEFNSQRFIIGNTPNQITLLATLPAKIAPAEEPRPANAPAFELSKAKVTSDTFRNLYEVEKTNGAGSRKPLPPDIRAKMRQLRESLET